MSDDVPQYTYGRAERQPYVTPPAPPPSQYWARFRERVAQWREKNAEQYAALEVDARRRCELPLEVELRPAQRMVVDAIVADAIRVLKGWPTQDEWERESKGSLA